MTIDTPDEILRRIRNAKFPTTCRSAEPSFSGAGNSVRVKTSQTHPV